MSKTVVKIENVSKLYQLGEFGSGSLTRDFNTWLAKVRGKEDPYQKIGVVNDKSVKSNSNFVWALRDINFDIHEGDTFALIGNNGSGKSTLLKILSKITSPTNGTVKIKGRVASLLEVGTGFHQEMTGRENTFMNGAILGMTKREIKARFDEIVNFAGIESYIDTPVKRYSSGMFVRLAFAVAAHLQSEILIIDEVLAVGDATFQKKCLGKMNDVAHDGRTVLFVSHNLFSVTELCKKGLLLINGEQGYVGDIKEAIAAYTNRPGGSGEILIKGNKGIIWNGILNKKELSDLRPDDDIHIRFSLKISLLKMEKILIDLSIYNEANQMVIQSRSNWLEFDFSIEPNSISEFIYTIKSPKLAPGAYTLAVNIYHGWDTLLQISNIDAFSVNANNYFGKSLYLDDVTSLTVPEFSIAKI